MSRKNYKRRNALTRLISDDIELIANRLNEYDQELQTKTGKGLLGISCHAYKQDEKKLLASAQSSKAMVVPITAGQGIIGNFSDTVSAILNFIGISSEVASKSDSSGVALAFEQKADLLFMADDDRFVGLNLLNCAIADNSQATGKVFAAALDLMAKGVDGKNVLILGCGPVGTAATEHLISCGANLGIYDLSMSAAKKLARQLGDAEILVEKDLLKALKKYSYLLDATPSPSAIPESAQKDTMFLAAPGVPLGMSFDAAEQMAPRLIHDKLELGVTSMAISLLSSC